MSSKRTPVVLARPLSHYGAAIFVLQRSGSPRRRSMGRGMAVSAAVILPAPPISRTTHLLWSPENESASCEIE